MYVYVIVNIISVWQIKKKEKRKKKKIKKKKSCKTHLDATMISRCQDDDTFVAIQPMGTFRFWRKDVYSRSIFLGLHPLPIHVRFVLTYSSLVILTTRSTIK